MALIMVSGFSVIPYITIYITSNVQHPPQDDIPLIYLFGGTATFFTSRLIGRLADRLRQDPRLPRRWRFRLAAAPAGASPTSGRCRYGW
jgi:predicted MFS family arabinose efflux permease